MPSSSLHSLLLTALSSARPDRGLCTDADLLAAFALRHDEAAFAERVRRHGRLVRGTAQRLVGNAPDADDVFQATFVLLARKAASPAWGRTVAPWLYQVVRRVASKARVRAGRQRRFAGEIEMEPIAPAPIPRTDWSGPRSESPSTGRLPRYRRGCVTPWCSAIWRGSRKMRRLPLWAVRRPR